ncbi:MAG: TPM domain-containing protein [Prevotella sp.]|nr:TPM domain-containing protein [Prevotella sp.]
MSNYVDSLNQLTRQYNDAIRALEDSYRMEKSAGWGLSSSKLKRKYSSRYDELASEYRDRKRKLFNAYQQANPVWAKQRKRWEWVFVAIVFSLAIGCTGTLAYIGEDSPAPAAAMSQTEDIYWNADNIEIPYLKDSTQYVANPDHVLTQNAVDQMNTTLRRLESELGIRSVFIIVNHIENDDPFRMAQDVGNKYGVGYDDRGLVVVVGYQDHSINMSPGRKLEADLTDAECHRLEQQYVVPAMRAEMPDSGMIYLAQAVFATLQQKQLPQMSQLTSGSDELDDQIATIMGLFMLAFAAAGAFFVKLNGRYQWLPLVGAVALLGNPFYESNGGGVYVGGGRGRGFGGGGGFSGGSFGGGSFGGGGATSRW